MNEWKGGRDGPRASSYPNSPPVAASRTALGRHTFERVTLLRLNALVEIVFNVGPAAGAVRAGIAIAASSQERAQGLMALDFAVGTEKDLRFRNGIGDGNADSVPFAALIAGTMTPHTQAA